MTLGTVTAAYGRQFFVRGDDGTQLVCVMRGKRSDSAVGDRVRYADTGGGGGVIDEVLARSSLLSRSDGRRTKLFAANLTRIAIVMAPEPPPSEELLVRALIAAHEADLEAAIVLNKADLLAGEPPPALARVAERVRVYQGLGVPVFRIAAKAAPQEAREALAPWMRDQSTLLLGQSGMGKSTLINALVPEANAATQAISQALSSGRHTTTFAKSFDLPFGGTIVDSPGFQEFGLMHLSLSQIQAAMPEIAELAGQCRFNNCSHRNEPGCAVREAVAAGRIDARRHELYVDLVEQVTRAPSY